MSGGAQLEYRVLGPLEALRDGMPVALPRREQRALLAMLLLNAGQAVSTDRLIEAVWGREPPRAALPALQGLVADLRQALGAASIAARSPGYVLELGSGQLDLRRFERLVEDGAWARAAGNPERAEVVLREALELWRGPALTGVIHDDFAEPAVVRLEELRLAAVEERIEAELALGRHEELIGELETVVAAHPLSERPRGQLMLALYRAGRRDEALDAYQEVRRMLAGELGIEPSPQLQRLERAILNRDASLDLDGPAHPSLPAGTITLLFTDIEGSTRLLHELGDSYRELLTEHRRVFRRAVTAHGGVEVDTQGDAHFVVFEEAGDAASAAADAQRAFAAHAWPGGVELRVRMGMHTGTPTPVEWGYVGVDLHRAARICSAAYGGQVLVSSDAARRLRADGIDVHELGKHPLKDFAEPEALAQLAIDGLPADFPPPRTGLQPPPAPVLVAPERSILVAPSGAESLQALLAVAEPLARSRAPHELIVTRLVPATEIRAATVELGAIRAKLLGRQVAVRSSAFTSRDPDRDLVRTATEQNVDLLLADCPPDLIDGTSSRDGWQVLEEAPCDVALLVPRRASGGTAVVVPCSGGEHDWAALELAAWVASSTDAPLLVVGVSEQDGRRDASRLLAVASMLVQALVGIVAEPLLIPPGSAGLVDAASDAALLVLPFPEDWRSAGIGRVRSETARRAGCPTLLVRRGLRPGGLAPPDGITRFTWSLGSRG